MDSSETLLKAADFKDAVGREIEEIPPEEETTLVSQCNSVWESTSKKHGPLRAATVFQIILKAFEHKVRAADKKINDDGPKGT